MLWFGGALFFTGLAMKLSNKLPLPSHAPIFLNPPIPSLSPSLCEAFDLGKITQYNFYILYFEWLLLKMKPLRECALSQPIQKSFSLLYKQCHHINHYAAITSGYHVINSLMKLSKLEQKTGHKTKQIYYRSTVYI